MECCCVCLSFAVIMAEHTQPLLMSTEDKKNFLIIFLSVSVLFVCSVPASIHCYISIYARLPGVLLCIC